MTNKDWDDPIPLTLTRAEVAALVLALREMERQPLFGPITHDYLMSILGKMPSRDELDPDRPPDPLLPPPRK